MSIDYPCGGGSFCDRMHRMSIFIQLLMNSVIAASIYALVALGFNLIYGTARFFNLAHGSMVLVGAYAVFFFSKQLGAPYPLGIFLGILIAGLIGVALDRGIYAHLRARKASNLVLLVASLGALTAIQAVLAMVFTSQFQTLTPIDWNYRIFSVAGGSITEVQLTALISAFVVYAALWVLLYRTAFGKAVRAISDDREVAQIIGIDTEKIIAWVFFLGSSIAGLAGVLSGLDTGIQPSMGMFLLLGGAIACIIGGIGNITGGLVGALILGLAENFGIWKLSGEWKGAISFALLILFLLWRPQGIMNVKK